ncbi:MAG: YceI family protein [Bacteroidota bacterium]
MTTKLLSTSALLLALVSAAGGQTKQVDLIKDESSVSYRLVHPLHTIEATSKDVVYQIDFDPTKQEIKSVSAQVDVTTFDSGNSNRDSHAMEVIDALTFPDVTFSSTTIAQSGDSLSIAGKLTFHGVTKDIFAAAVSKWSPNRLEVRGSFDVSLTAFNIERPSLLMIPVEDTLRFSFTGVFAWK